MRYSLLAPATVGLWTGATRNKIDTVWIVGPGIWFSEERSGGIIGDAPKPGANTGANT
jgi:hypothetical protein